MEEMTNMPVVAINLTLFWQMINFIILVVIFKKFFFKPISKIIEKRKQEIVSNMESAQKDKESSQAMKVEAEKHIKEAKAEAQIIVTTAIKKAEEAKEEILKETHAMREKMLKSAEADIIKIREQAKKELRDDMTEIAIKLAEKMIEKQLGQSKADGEKLIDQFIKEVGETK